MRVKKTVRLFISNLNLFKFSIRKYVIGFDSANIFIQRVDKVSLKLILKKNGALIGDNCDVETGLIFHNCNDYSNFIVGNNCHVGRNCFFDLRNKIIIEDNVVISMQCLFLTHLDLSKSELSRNYHKKSKEINIGKDTYIGARTTILMGVDIGESSLIGANSLVNKSFGKNNLVVGIPARTIGNTNGN